MEKRCEFFPYPPLGSPMVIALPIATRLKLRPSALARAKTRPVGGYVRTKQVANRYAVESEGESAEEDSPEGGESEEDPDEE